MNPDLVWLALYWAGYFIAHSVLASLVVKRAMARCCPRGMPAYRLFFNLIAVALVLPPLAYVHLHPGPVLWAWQGIWWWMAQFLAAMALIGFLVTLRGYDMAEFIGVRQWRARERRVEDQEGFHLSVLHRFVRHPWYSLAIVLIWTRDLNASWTVTATAVTLYFVIGSRLEERKLVRYHGEVYEAYRKQVPGLIPLPGRYLTEYEARRLIERGGNNAER